MIAAAQFTTIDAGKTKLDEEELDDEDDPNKVVPIPPYRSLLLFQPDNCLRKACHWFCNHRHFANFILVCIMVSSGQV